MIFDVFRGFRCRVKSANGIIVMQDILLWLAELAVVYYTVFRVNNAKIRAYEAVALICGAVIYFLTLSQYTIKLVSGITSFGLKILSAILFPAKKAVAFVFGLFKKFANLTKDKVFFARGKIKVFLNLIKRKITRFLRIKKHKK